MVYFNKGYINFLRELENHNSKSWFQENKKWYELAAREPFKKLLDDLCIEIRSVDPEIHMEAKDALFRINRDMRFSKYKLPYKTHMAAGFSRGGRKSQFAGYYLQIGHKNVAIGGGLPYLDRQVLRRIRIEIGYNLEAFNRIINNEDFVNTYGNLLGEQDTHLPKSFSDISEQNPIIAKKQLYYSAFYKTEDIIYDEALISKIMHHFKVGSQLNDFLIKAVSNFKKPLKWQNKRKVFEL
jgi:uncharacterized protein (TIGR02453 family)